MEMADRENLKEADGKVPTENPEGENSMMDAENAANEKAAEILRKAVPKKRGRPPKHRDAESKREAVSRKQGRTQAHPQQEDICGAVFRKRGRPPKNGWKAEELLEGEAINGAWETAAKLLLEGKPGMPIKEIAKEAHISRDMLYRYLKDEGFNRYLDALINEEIKGCEATIWHILKEMCMKGDLQAIKYYFELRGKQKKGAEEAQEAVVQIIDDVPDLSLEELKNIYGPLAGEELTDDA